MGCNRCFYGLSGLLRHTGYVKLLQSHPEVSEKHAMFKLQTSNFIQSQAA